MSQKKVWTEEEIQFIIQKYCKEGWTLEETAKTLHTKSDKVSKKLKELGYEIKRRGTTTNRRLEEDYFSIIDTEEKAYFLGLLFADGSVNINSGKRNPSIRLELVESDKAVLEKLRNELKIDSKLRYDKRANRKNGTYMLSVRSKKIADDLAKFNIVPNKTYLVNNVIIPQGFEKEFLRGYIDGDGSIYEDKLWHVSITGHSYDVITQVKTLMNDLINKSNDRKVTCYNNVYKYTLNGSDALKLLYILYNDAIIYIPRKREKAMLALGKNEIKSKI